MRLRYRIDLYDLDDTDAVGFQVKQITEPEYRVTEADLLNAELLNKLHQIGIAIIDIDIKE